MNRFKNLNWEKIGWVAAIEVAIIVVVLTFFLPGGFDLYVYYRQFAQGCMDCAFVPYYPQWLLWPLTLLPIQWVWPVVVGLTVFVVLVVCRLAKVNPVLVFLSFPFFAQLWLGQVDFIEIGGLALALLSANPYLRGVGIILALTKPQVTILAVLFLLIKEDIKDLPKLLAVPVVVIVVSLFVYGGTWPLEWLSNAGESIPLHRYRLASSMIWPLGLALIWVPVLFKDRRERFEAALLVTSIATPFYGVYAYPVFLVFRSSWWTLLLSYAWVVFFPWFGAEALKFAWVLPVGMLGHLAYEGWRKRKQGRDGIEIEL